MTDFIFACFCAVVGAVAGNWAYDAFGPIWTRRGIVPNGLVLLGLTALLATLRVIR